VGAVTLIHQRDGLFTEHQTLEFSVLVLFLLGLFTFSGAGRWSIDHHFSELDSPLSPERLPEATVARL
jgi:hypothetical protein